MKSPNIYADNIIEYCGQVTPEFVQKILHRAVLRNPKANIVFGKPEARYLMDQTLVIAGLRNMGFSNKMVFVDKKIKKRL
jgi:hypothetical protein